jgi:sugar lactone lactonase YvrE
VRIAPAYAQRRPAQIIYVPDRDQNQVVEHLTTDKGDATPFNIISGSDTLLNFPVALAVEPTGNLLVCGPVTPYILRFAPGASADAQPISTVNMGFSGCVGLAVDSKGDIVMLEFAGGISIVKFAPNASGSVVPTAVIAGSNTGLPESPGVDEAAVAVDPGGNIWIANFTDSDLEEFASNADGNVSPIVQIAGAATKLNHPLGIAIGSDGTIYVANTDAPQILEFGAGANGNVPPVREISGRHTKLNLSMDVTLDDRSNIWVINEGPEALLQFRRHARRNTSPVREISGSATGLLNPICLAIH